jgi:hypothetical protein
MPLNNEGLEMKILKIFGTRYDRDIGDERIRGGYLLPSKHGVLRAAKDSSCCRSVAATAVWLGIIGWLNAGTLPDVGTVKLLVIPLTFAR